MNGTRVGKHSQCLEMVGKFNFAVYKDEKLDKPCTYITADR